jgi:hypothetical protein
MAICTRSSLLVTAGFVAGAAVSAAGFVFAAPSGPAVEPSGRSYMVFVDEIRSHLVPAQTFSGEFNHKVTLADGSVREITLRPVKKNGQELVELTDKSAHGVHHSYMGPFATAIDGNLMINVKDTAQLKAEMAALAEARSKQAM